MLAINATFIGQFIVLLVLLWFIYKVVVPMLADPIEKRQRRIALGLAAAEQGEQSLAQAQVKAEALIGEARARAGQIIEQAQHRANDLIEQAKASAGAEPFTGWKEWWAINLSYETAWRPSRPRWNRWTPPLRKLKPIPAGRRK